MCTLICALREEAEADVNYERQALLQEHEIPCIARALEERLL